MYKVDMRWGLTLAAIPLLLLSCKDYDFYRRASYQQAKFSNKVDILWVVDNSASMQEEQDLLASNFDYFINAFTATSEEVEIGISGKTVSELMASYFFYKMNPETEVDFQIGVTTTDTNDDGERGKLVGETKILTPDTPNIVDKFRSNVMVGITGTGYEKGLDATRLAICRSLPWIQDEDGRWINQLNECNDLDDDEERDYNEGFMRDESTLAVIIVTDEGDSSTPTWEPDIDPEYVVEEYLHFFDQLKRTYVFSTIIPYPIEDCNDAGSSDQAIQRYIDITEETGGILASICDETFATSLRDIGSLISNLLKSFCLESIPEPGTIRVFIEGIEVFEDPDMEDGWVYDPSSNCIIFYGNAVPDYESIIEVFYIPQSSLAREVPF